MPKFKTEVVVLSVEHREEDNRIVTFSPVSKEGNANVANAIKLVCKGDKKDNFEEGEVYSLTIETAGKEEKKTTPPPASKKDQEAAAKQKAADVKKLTEAIEAKTKEFDQANEEAEGLKQATNELAEANPEATEVIEAATQKAKEKIEEAEKLEGELKALTDALDLLK